MEEENFWQDLEKASQMNQEYASLKKEIDVFLKTKEEIQDNLELVSLVEENELKNIEEEMIRLKKTIETLEIQCLLNKEFDAYNCYLEIHPGAGGTESCDWASMLARMYMRFCENNGYSYTIIESQKGEEAGLKSFTMYIKGLYAYGYLKGEKGIHRLVRISPFDAGARRHTSFASVLVTPEYKEDIHIDIKESDLKIDVYHSSGAGGQSVNTSNSAVRITHLPSKIVVTCQNERSQMQNKEQALRLLKNKLYEREYASFENKMNTIKGTMETINFGSQIRSYILEPYKLVKDNRSGYETSNVLKVLDGDIKPMLESVLKSQK